MALAFCFAAGFFAVASHAQANAPFKVIAFFSASYDAAHINYAHETNRFFPKFAAQHNFTYDSTKNWDNLNDATFLSKYQVVMFLDDQPSGAQHAGFQKYMEGGGGFIGFHVSAFNTNPADWDWYFNKFLGCGSFKSNTWGPTPAQMKVEDTTHPVTKNFPMIFKSETSEWYNWNNDIRKNPDIKILCSIDPSSYPLGTDPNQSWYSGYNPIVWTNTKYKMIYCNSGHNDMDYAANTAKSNTWDNAQHVQLILNALEWLAGRTTTRASTPARFQKDESQMQFHFGNSGLSISRPGLNDFGISILDLQGHLLASGKTATGVYNAENIRIGHGPYIIQSNSQAGSISKTILLK